MKLAVPPVDEPALAVSADHQLVHLEIHKKENNDQMRFIDSVEHCSRQIDSFRTNICHLLGAAQTPDNQQTR